MLAGVIKTLSAGNIGVRTENLDAGLAAAKLGGYEGLEFNISEIADMGAEVARGKFDAADIVPAVFGVPVDWRGEESKWQESLKGLPRLAKAASELGCTRCATWIMPADNDRPFDENLKFHVDRFHPIAEILGEHGVSIGLEFVGPKTLRDRFTHPFIYTAEGMLEMGRQIGPNVGLLLDSFHWYTSHGTIDDLKKLRPEQIVYVHLNDAAEGRTEDEQIDGDRRLPAASGVIDIAGFLKTLDEIGFAGPVACEPFYPPLNDLPSDEVRLKTVKQAVDKAFAQAGL
ncbi:Xylose isomerase domain protein TIM barrel [Fimbriimonas ginsengisoli Gsoil 348]|uniref:Xylose isomerase domain protein TIM barrel n=1 Tax=Fimbriimonas ginsengisoli Gsoil 348 TaxID=661478 RepID=A0A068NNC4_FIMGI|nr:Xylose isomerase domain protein TIM barrel [Fimbriimonas ginsengisoli Gsoil 348]